jgi:hypothetical protein
MTMSSSLPKDAPTRTNIKVRISADKWSLKPTKSVSESANLKTVKHTVEYNFLCFNLRVTKVYRFSPKLITETHEDISQDLD